MRANAKNFLRRKSSPGLMKVLGILCTLPVLWTCNSADGDYYKSIVWWDTAFAVSGVPFPSDSLFNRAVVETGNNFRLGQFLEKCQSRREVRIGFIGGSITQGAMATAKSARYSSRLCGFIRKTFPSTRIVELNAGIGATNSRFGCSRLQDDLLVNRPDMIVIEFAVNDELDDTAATAAAIEGLIRQSLQDPDVPVLIFQTMNSSGHDVNQTIQTRIARHYALPVIGYRSACWPLVEAGILPWSKLSPDDVHPNNDGHLIGAYLLYSFLKSEASILNDGADDDNAVPRSLSTDLYQHAGFSGPEGKVVGLGRNQGWDALVDGKHRYNFLSHFQGDKFAVKTMAREMSVTYHLSKESDSHVRIMVDGNAVDTLSSNFPEDWGGGYLKTRRIFRYPDQREHTVEFLNLTGGKFDLRYLLYAE